jgi:Gpi18-like mannosyltransferase
MQMADNRRRQAGAARSAFTSLTAAASHIPWLSVGVVVLGLALALALRSSLLDFKSDDYYASLKPWYNTIRSQGFAAFGTYFSTYNPPYLYLLYLIARFLPDVSTVTAVKLPGLVADFICALFVYLIVRLRFQGRRALPFAAAMLVLFAPSVVLNAAFWGQADSIFTAGMLGCVYFLMKRRSIPAMIFFGVSLAFKLQAIFLAPVIVALCLRRVVSWRSLAAVPVILFLAIVPSWIAGRSLVDLLNIYLYQASQFEFITMNAATAYTWLPGTKQVFNLFYVPGVIMGAAAGYVLFILAYKAPAGLSKPLLLELSLAATLVIPFFLPKMHERYFYPADILSIAVAFYYPELFFVPILVGGVSFLSYQPFLFQTEIVPLPILSGALLTGIGLLMYHAARQLFSESSCKDADALSVSSAGVPAPPTAEEAPS